VLRWILWRKHELRQELAIFAVTISIAGAEATKGWSMI